MSVPHQEVDPELIDKIVLRFKSQGFFDQVRKDCLADVDSRPAYENLREKVNGTVASFLSEQPWKEDLNKNQLRESLRQHVQQSFLEIGVNKIVEQVVNPRIFTVLMPKVEDVVYEVLGVEKPSDSEDRGHNRLRFLLSHMAPPRKPPSPVPLLPTDLDPVSPVSLNETADSSVLNDSSSKINDETSKGNRESAGLASNDNSHLSGISELSSHGGSTKLDISESAHLPGGEGQDRPAAPTTPPLPPADDQPAPPSLDFDNFTNLKEKLKKTDPLHKSEPREDPDPESEIPESPRKDCGTPVLDEPKTHKSPFNLFSEDSNSSVRRPVPVSESSRNSLIVDTENGSMLQISPLSNQKTKDEDESAVVPVKEESQPSNSSLKHFKPEEKPECNNSADMCDISSRDSIRTENGEKKGSESGSGNEKKQSSSKPSSKPDKPDSKHSHHRHHSSRDRKHSSSKETRSNHHDRSKEKDKTKSNSKDSKDARPRDREKSKDSRDPSSKKDGDSAKKDTDLCKKESETGKKLDPKKDSDSNTKSELKKEGSSNEKVSESSRNDVKKEKEAVKDEHSKKEPDKKESDHEKKDSESGRKGNDSSKHKDSHSKTSDSKSRDKSRSDSKHHRHDHKHREDKNGDDKKSKHSKDKADSERKDDKKNHKDDRKDEKRSRDDRHKEKDSKDASKRSKEIKSSSEQKDKDRDRKRKREKCDDSTKKEDRRSRDRDDGDGGHSKDRKPDKKVKSSGDHESKGSSESSTKKEGKGIVEDETEGFVEDERKGIVEDEAQGIVEDETETVDGEGPSEIDLILQRIGNAIQENEEKAEEEISEPVSSPERRRPKIANNIYEVRKIIQARKCHGTADKINDNASEEGITEQLPKSPEQEHLEAFSLENEVEDPSQVLSTMVQNSSDGDGVKNGRKKRKLSPGSTDNGASADNGVGKKSNKKSRISPQQNWKNKFGTRNAPQDMFSSRVLIEKSNFPCEIFEEESSLESDLLGFNEKEMSVAFENLSNFSVYTNKTFSFDFVRDLPAALFQTDNNLNSLFCKKNSKYLNCFNNCLKSCQVTKESLNSSVHDQDLYTTEANTQSSTLSRLNTQALKTPISNDLISINTTHNEEDSLKEKEENKNQTEKCGESSGTSVCLMEDMLDNLMKENILCKMDDGYNSSDSDTGEVAYLETLPISSQNCKSPDKSAKGKPQKNNTRSLQQTQRYDSSELYKPRPLIPSSSRRNRQLHGPGCAPEDMGVEDGGLE